ncbi:nucleotidyltransferase family protein [Alteribacillus bidgolensis]|nr:nucleotidyltransferase family protein [Alteribacillus bidgolensis]
MEDWQKVLVPPHTKIQETIQMIDAHALQIALIVNEDNKLLGTVTDGDIRRGILSGVSLNNNVNQIMNTNPVTIPKMKDKKSILEILKVNKLRHLPVVNDSGCVVGIERLEDLLHPADSKNWVVIMAGGLGSRLQPLTNKCPKAMLHIGGKPVLETILQHFITQGFHRFCISVNYRAEQIINYFGDGSKWGADIRYIQEDRKMGTAGSLSLFPITTEKPIIVMNGDVLTNVNFNQLMNFHRDQQVEATVAVRSFDFQVPYGFVKVKKDRLIGFEEKPIYTSFINAGIYVLHPALLNKIPKNSYFDINQLFEIMLLNKEQISTFPIREYWIDIGNMEDFNQAKLDFNEVFK